jgi:hypothetical protein
LIDEVLASDNLNALVTMPMTETIQVRPVGSHKVLVPKHGLVEKVLDLRWRVLACECVDNSDEKRVTWLLLDSPQII